LIAVGVPAVVFAVAVPSVARADDPRDAGFG
jgi:hypothetical protein